MAIIKSPKTRASPSRALATTDTMKSDALVKRKN